jgi:putative ABC transport system permease protein
MIDSLLHQLSMIRNYITIALRGMVKHKGYSALNISGLAVGLSCSFFIYLWIQHEMRIDRFHENGDRLYQVKINDHGRDRISTRSNVPLPLAESIATTYPEVAHTVLTLPIKAALRRNDHAGREEGYFASPGFFKAFSFPLILGDPVSVLVDPNSLVISESMAARYFGADWLSEGAVLGNTLSMSYWQSAGGVLGQAVTVNNEKEFTITGVFGQPSHRSTLDFDVVVPIQEIVQTFAHLKSWGPRWFELTLALRSGTDMPAFREKIKTILVGHIGQDVRQEAVLQLFRDTYLYGTFEQGKPSGGRIDRVYLIGLVGLAVLLIACINFTNLVTARSNQRAREIGVRKTMGATPSNLVQQFLGEAIMTALLALVCAVEIMAIVLPLFNSVAGTELAVSSIGLWDWAIFGGIALFTGIVAGSYPAFYLASLNAIRVFRNEIPIVTGGEVGVRSGLVVVQFGISAFLIVGALTIYQQLSYLQTKDLGINKDNVVMVRLEGTMVEQYDAVRQSLLQSGGIQQVAISSAHPLDVSIKNSNVIWGGKELDESLPFTVLRTDDQFAETMELDLSSGRFFERDRDKGQLRFVVNQSAVQAMGLEQPIGHPFAFGFDVDDDGSGLGQIIGVVKDFHTGSAADESISPLVFRYEPEQANFLLVRVSDGSPAPALKDMGRILSVLNPGYPFEYTFLDEAYQAYYGDEVILKRLSQVVASVAVFIASLGLFGLSAFAVQQRTKEIGIRRVLGATRSHVMYILSSEFVILVAIGLAVSLPVAYWAMERWLTSFAYRIDLGLGTLMTAAVLSLGIAILTVGCQAYLSIRSDPARSLRTE